MFRSLCTYVYIFAPLRFIRIGRAQTDKQTVNMYPWGTMEFSFHLRWEKYVEHNFVINIKYMIIMMNECNWGEISNLTDATSLQKSVHTIYEHWTYYNIRVFTLFYFFHICHRQCNAFHPLRSTWQLPYILSIEYDVHQGALLPPHLNIPAKGFVPDAVETFTLHLPCAGNISDEVPIAINLFVQGPPKRNDTRLIFKRNKICLKGKSSEQPNVTDAIQLRRCVL